jgi:hypothetical protein
LGVACSPSTGSSDDQGMNSAQGSGSAQQEGSGGSDGVSAGATGNFGGTFGVKPAAGGAGPEVADAACAAQSLEPESIEVTVEVPVTETIVEEIPSSLYLMLDRSGSMVSDNILGTIAGWFGGGGSNTNKWDIAVGAITQFVQDPGSQTLDAALHYFPGGGQCDGAGYDQPTVNMGTLGAIAGNIVSSLGGQNPNGNTPTAGALRGQLAYCAAFNRANPDKQCVAVLITDGQPSDCDPRDGNGLGNLAAQALANDRVVTFAVGMQGADFGVLNRIGELGGGDCTPGDTTTWACDVTTSPDAFLRALQIIRESVTTVTHTETRIETQHTVLPCEWGIPDAPEGEEFDKDLVNVQFRTGGATPQKIGVVDSEAACASVAGGWYYDDPDSPTKIHACEQTCSVIQSIDTARVDILFGCASEPALFQ